MQNGDSIIIIEDDLDDQDVIRTLCAEIKICDEILFFNNGREALAYMRSVGVRPFLVLCDINMPQMDGLKLREEINKDPVLKKRSIPFIFFSTAASDQQINKAYDLTVQGFFLKGNSFKETADTLQTIFKYWRLCKHPR
jgi:CheY-like chemotaxis protein